MFAEFLYLCGMEKKILIIPDVHGRRFWRDAIESDDYDKVIFLGDYLDPYPDEGIGPFTAQEGHHSQPKKDWNGLYFTMTNILTKWCCC